MKTILNINKIQKVKEYYFSYSVETTNLLEHFKPRQIKCYKNILDALCDLVPFAQFKKHEKHLCRCSNFIKCKHSSMGAFYVF